MSAETQKWFDQNHTSRSTKPISAVLAATKCARASLRKMRCWTLGSGGFLGSALASVLSSGLASTIFGSALFGSVDLGSFGLASGLTSALATRLAGVSPAAIVVLAMSF